MSLERPKIGVEEPELLDMSQIGERDSTIKPKINFEELNRRLETEQEITPEDYQRLITESREKVKRLTSKELLTEVNKGKFSLVLVERLLQESNENVDLVQRNKLLEVYDTVALPLFGRQDRSVISTKVEIPEKSRIKNEEHKLKLKIRERLAQIQAMGEAGKTEKELQVEHENDLSYPMSSLALEFAPVIVERKLKKIVGLLKEKMKLADFKDVVKDKKIHHYTLSLIEDLLNNINNRKIDFLVTPDERKNMLENINQIIQDRNLESNEGDSEDKEYQQKKAA